VCNLALAHHFNGNARKCEYFMNEADRLGYRNMMRLRKIISGELSIRD
jgi:hypothetical protein